MKPDFSTPSTLYLATWVEDNAAFIVGSLRTEDDEVITDVIEQASHSKWVALAAALREAAIVGPMVHLLLMSNDEAFTLQLRGKTPPTPTEFLRTWVVYDAQQQAKTGRKGEYVNVGWGGDPDQWECLQRLAMWPCGWRAMIVPEMLNVRMRWLQHFKPSQR